MGEQVFGGNSQPSVADLGGRHASCDDVIREERRKHQHELSGLKSEFERRLRALLDELTAPRSGCKACMERLSPSTLRLGALVAQVPRATNACPLTVL